MSVDTAEISRLPSMQIIVDRWGFPMEPEVGFVVEENDGEHGEGNENCKGYENG